MRNVCLAAAFGVLLSAVAPAISAAPLAAQQPAIIQPAVREADGSLTHSVRSGYQAGETEIRVLLPQAPPKDRRLPVVYFLPVEPGRENRYGDPIAEAAKLKVADRYGVICVEPTFAALPWYADHPTDTSLAQETYFLKVVLPYVEAHYPAVAAPEGRLLVGFSKSGWGAWSLLLRHPDIFGRAASWDAPLTMTWPSKYGSQPFFGTAANFENYRITKLLEERGASVSDPNRPRLILLGHGNFPDHGPIHEQLGRLSVSHIYSAGPKQEHVWGSGWLEPALVGLFGKQEPQKP